MKSASVQLSYCVRLHRFSHTLTICHINQFSGSSGNLCGYYYHSLNWTAKFGDGQLSFLKAFTLILKVDLHKESFHHTLLDHFSSSSLLMSPEIGLIDLIKLLFHIHSLSLIMLLARLGFVKAHIKVNNLINSKHPSISLDGKPWFGVE